MSEYEQQNCSIANFSKRVVWSTSWKSEQALSLTTALKNALSIYQHYKGAASRTDLLAQLLQVNEPCSRGGGCQVHHQEGGVHPEPLLHSAPLQLHRRVPGRILAHIVDVLGGCDHVPEGP